MSAVAESITTTGAWEWRATGTTWRIHHTGGVDAGLAATIAQAVERDEARWSRFRPDSEVARVNASAGRAVHVSPATLDLLEVCVYWIRATGGVFQPLVGGALVAWGYRRSLNDRAAYARTSPDPRRLEGRPQIDRRQGTAMIPAGTRLDLGGIAKSWMAARAAGLLRGRCDDPAVLVDAGGDLVAARGRHLVAVEDPRAPDAPPVARVWVEEGQGVATSGFGRRRWQNGDGRAAHHLIDPETGAPGPRTHATVVADDPVAADVLAKVLTLRPGRIAALDEAAMVMVDAGIRVTAAWAEVTRMILWDVARASAFVAFACYTLVVAWGIALSARVWRPPAPQMAYHRFLASLGLVAVAIHIGALMLDRYARVTVASLVGLDTRPSVVVGAAALWLIIALPLSFRLKQARWMSQRAWRSLHYFGYAVWGLSLIHGVTAGTDSRSAIALAVYGTSAAIVGGAAWYRWIERPVPAVRPAPSRERLPARAALEIEGSEP